MPNLIRADAQLLIAAGGARLSPEHDEHEAVCGLVEHGQHRSRVDYEMVRHVGPRAEWSVGQAMPAPVPAIESVDSVEVVPRRAGEGVEQPHLNHKEDSQRDATHHDPGE